MSKLTIKLSQDTVGALKGGGYRLLIFRGLTTDVSNVKPLIWKVIHTENLELENPIWSNSNNMYGFKSHRHSVVDGKGVMPAAKMEVKMGDQFIIKDNGDIDVTPNVNPDKISIYNQGNSIVAGLSDNEQLERHNICAVEFSGRSQLLFKPRNIFLVSFISSDHLHRNLYLKKIQNPSATVEFFEQARQHIIHYDYTSGIWSRNQDEKFTESCPWFRFFNNEVNIASKIVNHFP